MRFSLAISHTPWVPERAASMKRLQDCLPDAPADYEVFCDKEPNHVWSAKMWQWAASKDVDWCVFLQDDAVVAPAFFARLGAIASGGQNVYAVGNKVVGHVEGNRFEYDVIGLQVAHPAALPLAFEGCAGFTTSDGLVGVGYAVRRIALIEFLRWRTSELQPGAVENVTEDSLLGLWCAVTERKVYHPIPTIVDHDTALPSTYANDTHGNRRSRVRWDTPFTPEGIPRRIPHMGRFYMSTPALAKKAVIGITSKDVARMAADNGEREARRINYARKARGIEPKARIFIATPVRGGVDPNYAMSIWGIIRDSEIDVEGTLEVAGLHEQQEDVVRTRSKQVAHFLNQTTCTHILFVDSDIEVSPKVVRGMLAANKGFIAAPYPRRDTIDFHKVRLHPTDTAESVAYMYSLKMSADVLQVGEDGCAEVDALPLGCALISRELLERMVAAYPELMFEDRDTEACALFQLILAKRELMSEDFSFCMRVRESSEKVWMYLGEGSPVSHHGGHCYRGDLGAFGLRRT